MHSSITSLTYKTHFSLNFTFCRLEITSPVHNTEENPLDVLPKLEITCPNTNCNRYDETLYDTKMTSVQPQK